MPQRNYDWLPVIRQINAHYGNELPLVVNEKPPFRVVRKLIFRKGPTYKVAKLNFKLKFVSAIKILLNKIPTYFNKVRAKRRAIKILLGS